MSKKSRKRNKRILTALAALGTGLALANRGKGTEMSNISVDSGRGGDSANALARKKANTPYTDAIMRSQTLTPRTITNPAMFLKGIGDDPIATMDGYPIQAGAKKGGRIVKTKSGGKAVRGYGRAYKGRKK